jgi:hypothetical protein
VAMFTSPPKGDGPSLIPEADVRRCPKKSRLFSALIWVLELNRKISSSYKQMLGARMRWPAVPPLNQPLALIIVLSVRKSYGKISAIMRRSLEVFTLVPFDLSLPFIADPSVFQFLGRYD